MIASGLRSKSSPTENQRGPKYLLGRGPLAMDRRTRGTQLCHAGSQPFDDEIHQHRVEAVKAMA
jgi:hypothetical protein